VFSILPSPSGYVPILRDDQLGLDNGIAPSDSGRRPIAKDRLGASSQPNLSGNS